MKRITTLVRIANPEKGIYRATFPEYEDCPEFADSSLEDIIDTAPVYISIYVILNNGGEFNPHKCSLKDLVETGDKVFTNYINCDARLVEEDLNEASVSPDAFFNWAQEHTDSILNSRKEPVVETGEEKKPEPAEKTENASSIRDLAKEEERKMNDATAELGDMFDEDVDQDVFPEKRETENVTEKSKNVTGKKQNNKNFDKKGKKQDKKPNP